MATANLVVAGCQLESWAYQVWIEPRKSGGADSVARIVRRMSHSRNVKQVVTLN